MNKPVAWIWSEDGCNLGVCLDQDKQIGKQEFQDYDIPLYTLPAKELTDEEILKLEEIEFENYCVDKESRGRKTATITDPEWAIWFARAILRKASE